ncbi:LarC family nickel insertion protein [Streptomyces sp. NPDC006978]|uniref:LarC family nickel insertion protein n=1 Tax=Streptomyces sp. NPDC006978 TaxID=3364769 RepID=UPI00369DAE9C
MHFHEVGAYDALADIVGCAAAAESLGLLEDGVVITCSPLAAGSGFVRCAHGRMPVPVPAVLNIAAHTGLQLVSGDLAGERTTPTGAAIVAAAAEPGVLPPMTVRAVGTGGGRRDTVDRPNVTRVVIGESTAVRGPDRGEVLAIESTVDDMDPRLWPSVLRAVREAGAWDCWTTGIVARHGRPGQVVTALCSEQVRQAVTDALFRHTSTLGVRWSTHQRVTLPRRSVTVPVGPPGHAQAVVVKVGETPGSALTVQPELSDAERVARVLDWPVRAVCDGAVSSYRQAHGMEVTPVAP